MSFFLDNIDAMIPYVPGAQPEPGRRVVKLNQNENPYPPSPRALAALESFNGASLRLYPDPMAPKFTAVASEVLGVPPEQIIVGDGSDDLIIMLARAAAGPGRAIAYGEPTFPYYFTQAQVQGAPVAAIPCDADFTLPLEALAEADAALTFVASPNSPTGAAATTDQLDWLAGKLSGLLAIDEAYADFAAENALPLVDRHDNVVVLRTLSKGYSLAALRLGFAVAGKAIRQGLLKTKAIYNVGPIPAAVGAAAMADQSYHDECVAAIIAERKRLATALIKRRFFVYPSHGNFLLAAVPGGDAPRMVETLKAGGILVRYFNSPLLQDKLRISIGTADDTDALLAAIDAML
ncbi:MAG: histidinol-phosphate transaminase [Planctomycetes bacterium]|nr:histidinol-phosphate transaminase [Planctomycetota bacterium]